MRQRIGSLVVGAGVLALAMLGVPGAVAAGGAQASDHHGGGSTTQTFTLTPSGSNLKVVGTSAWSPTEGAGPTGAEASATTTKLTAAAVAAATPRIPDVGITVRSETVGGGTVRSSALKAPGTGNHGRSHTNHHHDRTGSGFGTQGTQGNVTGPSPGLTSVAGSDAYDQGVLHPVYKTGSASPLPGIDIEPPDQGLCAGNGYVMEVNNMVVQIYAARTMQPLSANGMALEKLFDAPEVFGGGGTGTYSVQGDPRCYYDPQAHRWFASQIYLTEVDGSPTFGWAGEFVAASTSPAPTGGWHVYFIPDQFDAQKVDGCNGLPPSTLPSATNPSGPANPCYGDQPLLGVNGNAVFISVNEYALAGNTPLGGVGTEYALSKAGLLSGQGSRIYWGHLGDTVTRPGAGACPFNTPAYHQTTAALCPWYSIVPAVSDGAYVTGTRGTFYAMSAVTFSTSGGHQVALWKFTNTAAVTYGGPQVTGSVTVATTVAYSEPPATTVKGSYTATESLAPQRLGSHPLGTLWKTLTGQTPISWPTGEGMIATNTDRVTTAAYDPANGTVWGALNSASQSRAQPNADRGQPAADITWFRVTPQGSGASASLRDVASGSLSARGADDFFPSISFTARGTGIMDYVVSGQQYYPSTGYTFMSSNGPTSTVHLARAGAGPTDGFSEYTATYNRPRWGDYSTAVATGGTFFFAAEMVNQSCSVSQFEATFTCGGTRDIEANWGTSVNRLPAGDVHQH